VIDLRTLLEMMRKSQAASWNCRQNRYLALTDALYRRLQQVRLTANSGRWRAPASAGRVRAGRTGHEVGTLKSDKLWKEHLARMQAQEAFTPNCRTLQAELRDYQVEGYNWLARLAHWGVGACLADDMGLGKTLQALALILSRAPQGPTLVVAPTSGA
jgi:SNF2 family DNA or RNA helicase